MVTPDPLPPPDDTGRIVRFRPRGAAKGDWQWSQRSQRNDDPVDDLAKFEQRESEDDYRHRMTVNALGLVVTILLIIGGLWLADKILENRKIQDCVLSGRKNCAPIEATPSQRY
jgi:hypothetical protein